MLRSWLDFNIANQASHTKKLASCEIRCANKYFREHLGRAHRPVQCEHCYHIFPFKSEDRSYAVSELEKHIQQDDRCPRGSASLEEGINDAEWSRLSEEKKKNRKGKSKRNTTPEQTQSPSKQWYEIWTVLFPKIPRPSTPCQ